MIRFFDITLSLIGLVLTLPILMIVMVLSFFDTRSPLFIQKRVGRYQRPFNLVKFRTMKVGTAHVASHMASRNAITPFGHFLRRSKLDELPQLWNVLKGDMSLVGPRPCLYSQLELLTLRQQRGVFDVRPGITGLSQINDIDMSVPDLLARTDAEMIKAYSITNYFRYIFQTITGKGRGDRVK